MLFFISNNVSSIDSGSTELINDVNRGYFEKISCSLNELTNCTSFAQALPFDLISIQVDGGSEFRDEFEQACEVLKNPLFVLSPRKPNGMVVWNGPM